MEIHSHVDLLYDYPVRHKLESRTGSGIQSAMSGSRIVVSQPTTPSSQATSTTSQSQTPSSTTSSGTSTSGSSSESGNDSTVNPAEAKTVTASPTARMSSKHPVLKRKRNFVGLPPIFAEAWGALEELEEQELMSNAGDAKTSKAKRKLALQRRGRRKNLLQGVTLKSVVPATYHGPRLALDAEGEMEANQYRSIVSSPGTTPPTSPLPTTHHCVTLEFVLQMINAIKDGINLHYQYAQHIVFHAARHFEHKESIVTDIVIPEGGRLVVVGDLHGQLDDLLTIFKVADFPSEKNFYLFNGDIVDRGSHSVQLLLIIYALKLVYPSSVHINRGNHEHRLMNARYGFELQVKQLYDEALYELIQTSFNWLPIATLVEESAFIVHGGLTQYGDFTIDELRSIKRRDLLPHPLVQSREEFILEQLLWSDPGRGGSGFIANRRGAGILFSGELTASFLKRNNLQLILRSHQMVDTGYSRCHGGQLVTIFSASNYCGTNDNLGAIAVFDADSGKLHFIQYEAETNLLAYTPSLEKDSLDPKIVSVPQQNLSSNSSSGSSSRYTHPAHTRPRSNTDSQRDEALQKLHERILRKRHTLYMAFVQLDKKSGFVTLNDWAAVMTMVIRIDLHWQALWPFLGYPRDEAEEEALASSSSSSSSTPNSKPSKKKSGSSSSSPGGGGNSSNSNNSHHLGSPNSQTSSSSSSSLPEFINYTKFLDTYTTIVDPSMASVLQRKQSQLVDKLCRKFYERSLDLKQVFNSMDKDGDGRISYEEFVRGLRRFKHALGLDGGQLYDLMRSVDTDHDGLVRWKDFLDRFQLKFEEISQVPEEHKAFLLGALSELANVIYRKRGASESAKVKRMFRSLAGIAGATPSSSLPSSPTGYNPSSSSYQAQAGSGSSSERERSSTPPPYHSRLPISNNMGASNGAQRYPARRPLALSSGSPNASPLNPSGLPAVQNSPSRPLLTEHTFTPPSTPSSTSTEQNQIGEHDANAPNTSSASTAPLSSSNGDKTDINAAHKDSASTKSSSGPIGGHANSKITHSADSALHAHTKTSSPAIESLALDVASGIAIKESVTHTGRASSASRLDTTRSVDSTRSTDSTRSESLKYVAIGFKEFCAGIQREMAHMNWKKSDIKILFNYLDRNADGQLSYFEFRRCFKFQDSRSDKWAGAAIAAEIQNNRNKLLKLFVEMDVEGSGQVPLGDFKTVFNTLLGKALEEEEARVLGQAGSEPSGPSVPSGTIDYNRFLRSFRAGRKHQHTALDRVNF